MSPSGQVNVAFAAICREFRDTTDKGLCLDGVITRATTGEFSGVLVFAAHVMRGPVPITITLDDESGEFIQRLGAVEIGCERPALVTASFEIAAKVLLPQAMCISLRLPPGEDGQNPPEPFGQVLARVLFVAAPQ